MTKSREELTLEDLPAEIITEIHAYFPPPKNTSFYRLSNFFGQYKHFAEILLINKKENLSELILIKFIEHLIKQFGIVLDPNKNAWAGYENPRSFIKAIIFLDKLCWEIFGENSSQNELKRFEENYPKENPIISHLVYRYKRILFANSMEDGQENLKQAWQNGNYSALFALCVVEQDLLASSEKHDDVDIYNTNTQEAAKQFLSTNYQISLTDLELSIFLKAFSYHFDHALLLYEFLMRDKLNVDPEINEFNKLLNKFSINKKPADKLNLSIEKLKDFIADLVLESDPIAIYKPFLESLLTQAFELSELPSIQLYKFNTSNLSKNINYIKSLLNSIKDNSWELNLQYTLMLPKIAERKDITGKITAQLTTKQIEFITEITHDKNNKHFNLAADIFLIWSENKIEKFFTLLEIYAKTISNQSKVKKDDVPGIETKQEKRNEIFTTYQVKGIEIGKRDFCKFYNFILNLKLLNLKEGNKEVWENIFNMVPLGYLLDKTTNLETIQKLFSYDSTKILKINGFLKQLKTKDLNSIFSRNNHKFDVIVFYEHFLCDFSYDSKDPRKLKKADLIKINADKSKLMFDLRNTFLNWGIEAVFYFFGLKNYPKHSDLLYLNAKRYAEYFRKIIPKTLDECVFFVALMHEKKYNRINLNSALCLMGELGIAIIRKLSVIQINDKSSLLEFLCTYPPEIPLARMKTGDLQFLITKLNEGESLESIVQDLPPDMLRYINVFNYYIGSHRGKRTYADFNPQAINNVAHKHQKITHNANEDAGQNSLSTNRNSCFYHANITKTDTLCQKGSSQLDNALASAKQLLTTIDPITDAEKMHIVERLQQLFAKTLSPVANIPPSTNNDLPMFKK